MEASLLQDQLARIASDVKVVFEVQAADGSWSAQCGTLIKYPGVGTFLRYSERDNYIPLVEPWSGRPEEVPFPDPGTRYRRLVQATVHASECWERAVNECAGLREELCATQSQLQQAAATRDSYLERGRALDAAAQQLHANGLSAAEEIAQLRRRRSFLSVSLLLRVHRWLHAPSRTRTTRRPAVARR